MAEYLVRPWNTIDLQTDQELDMYVPPEIDELAQNIITYYPMEVYDKTLITSKPDKGGAIWKIGTDKGPRSLKLLHRKPTRSLFSVGAQNYVVKQGARVPELKPTKSGALHVEKGGKVWIVTDWIESLTPASKDLKGAQELCYGLGEFHKLSRGYIPPQNAQRSSRLARWPNYYKKILTKISWFRNIAMIYENTSTQSLLPILDMFEGQALDAISRLERSYYPEMVSMGGEYWGLAHQDYGWSNGQKGPGGLWVIDLDGVSYDLPFRDLRKLISSTMDDMGIWDSTWIRGMIEAYHQANPLAQEAYEVLLIDFAFPNEFYKHINEMLYDPVGFMNNDLERSLKHLLLLEQTKGAALKELAAGKKNFTTGNYTQKLESKKRDQDENENLTTDLNAQDYRISKKKIQLSQNPDGKLKILMICTEKLPVPPVRGGAIQTYIEGISGYLSKKHDITILGTSDPSLPHDERLDNIRYVRVDGQQVLDIYAALVTSFLENNSYDLIHVFNRPRLIPLIRKVAPHSRLILSMHNDMFNHEKISPQEARTAINEVEKIITVSNYVGDTIRRLYPQAAPKIQTIYSGVDLKRFIPHEKSKLATATRQKYRAEHDLQNKTVVLFVGRLTPKKGADLLIQALKEVYSTRTDFALVIVGGTWYSEDTVTDYVAYVRTLAENAPFPVITTGYVPAHLIHEWFWAGDIFVCPSTWQEPLARVHYEAMAASLPFVTTARGGNPEVVIGQNGLIVNNPEDPQEFAKKLKLLITDLKKRQRMGQIGRHLAEERFGWERVAREVLDVWTPSSRHSPAIDDSEVMPDHESIDHTPQAQNAEQNLFEQDVLESNPEDALILEIQSYSSVVKITRDMVRR